MLRASLMGLSGGLLLGGLFMMGLSLKLRIFPPDCSALSELECGIEREAATEVGRLQGVSGAALLALGIAIIVLLRSRPRPAPPP